mgnify:FL=1
MFERYILNKKAKNGESKMSKTTLVVIIYIIGVILGAFFLDIWSSDTNIKKGFMALGWTALFLIAIFFADRNKDE